MNQTVIKVVKDMSSRDDKITGETRLKEDLGFDSLRMVELVVALEDALNIEFNESDMEPSNLITVDDLVGIAKKYAAAK